MNEQQLQQILTIQQAIAAAATAAMINTLLNPQQAAANLVNQNAHTESPTTPNADFHDQDLQDGSNRTSPTGQALTDNNNHHHNSSNQLHLQHHQRQDNPVAASLAAVSAAAAAAAATGSNMMISPASSQSPNNNNSNNHSNKKLKRHNQAPQAFSRQHNSPGSSSAFLPNNVGLPRKLVRGQDVWLGRGAEQTRQILKCMWCNQSFRTLAEMTHHMKITQHYTNIISQEQITSWKQPEGSESSIPSGRQHSKQSISSKNLDEFHEVVASASEKSIDSEREDSFSNDEANTPPPLPPPQLPQSKRQHRTKARPERTISISNSNTNIKSPESDTTTNTTTTNSNKNTSIASAVDNEKNSDSNEDKSTIEQQQPTDLGVGDEDDSNSNDENKCKRDNASREDSQDNEDDCDKKASKKRHREDDLEADANTTNTDISVKQELPGSEEGIGGGGGGGGSGDPLSALETMVEKSFDPRMRPGVASGGILQRLGIDEEVCPPWQHLNYANWYAAAAYGHPMAAALLAAGMNLQNGIKLSKNMGSKKNDD